MLTVKDATMVVTHPWIDCSQAPLYRQIYPAHATWEEIVAFRAAVTDIVTSATGPFAWVDDLGRGLGVAADAKARNLIAAEEKKLEAPNREHCAGVALYVTSIVTRGIVSAVYWMAPPVFPYKLFDDPRAAEAWAKGQLRKRGVSIP